MKIQVEMTVGCEIIYNKSGVGLLNGIVTNVNGDTITIEGPGVVHISKIIQFTFGGVWMRNMQYDNGWWAPAGYLRP